MLELLSGLHGTVAWPVSAAPSGFGEPWLSHMTMPIQNVGRSWKLSVPPLPSCCTFVGRALGRALVMLLLLPDPALVEYNSVAGSSWPTYPQNLAPSALAWYQPRYSSQL